MIICLFIPFAAFERKTVALEALNKALQAVAAELEALNRRRTEMRDCAADAASTRGKSRVPFQGCGTGTGTGSVIINGRASVGRCPRGSIVTAAPQEILDDDDDEEMFEDDEVVRLVLLSITVI